MSDNSFDLGKAAKNLHDLQKVGEAMGLHGALAENAANTEVGTKSECEWTALRELGEKLVKARKYYRELRATHDREVSAAGDMGSVAHIDQWSVGRAEDALHGLQQEAAKAVEALAAAAPAPPAMCECTRGLDGTLLTMNCPRHKDLILPPQDGQGAELLGPQSDIALAHSSFKDMRIVVTGEALPNASPPSWRKRIEKRFANAQRRGCDQVTMRVKDIEALLAALGPPRGGSSSDLADSDSLRVGDEVWVRATVTSPMAMYDAVGVVFVPGKPEDALTPHAWVSRRSIVMPTPSLPEAVAGNASAPVGEKRQPSEKLVIDLDAIAREMFDDGFEKCTKTQQTIIRRRADQLKHALAGQPSGVGEPLPTLSGESAREFIVNEVTQQLGRIAKTLNGGEHEQLITHAIMPIATRAAIRAFDAAREVEEPMRCPVCGETEKHKGTCSAGYGAVQREVGEPRVLTAEQAEKIDEIISRHKTDEFNSFHAADDLSDYLFGGVNYPGIFAVAREVGEGLREALEPLLTKWRNHPRDRKDWDGADEIYDDCANDLEAALAAPAPKPAPPAEPGNWEKMNKNRNRRHVAALRRAAERKPPR